MRGICLVLVLLGAPALAAAQYERPPQPGSAVAPISGSLPSIGLPLPSIGLPLPSIGLPPRAPVEDQYNRPGQQRGGNQRGGSQRGDNERGDSQRGGERRDGEWRDGGQWRGSVSVFAGQRTGPGYIYVGPQYPSYIGPQYPTYFGPQYPYAGMPSAGVVVSATNVPGMITVVPEPVSGTLRLEVEPADILQVFVDGQYVGTPADLGSQIELPPGSRRIEFRAPGYKTLTIDAQIVSQRTIVYRAALDRIAPTRVLPPPAAPVEAPAPAPPPAPTGNRTMYLIPGCYMGNVPPQDLKLPAGCDLSRLTTITP